MHNEPIMTMNSDIVVCLPHRKEDLAVFTLPATVNRKRAYAAWRNVISTKGRNFWNKLRWEEEMKT